MDRPFFGFLMSTFQDGNSKKAFEVIGLKNWPDLTYIFSDGAWYYAAEPFEIFRRPVETWLKKHSIEELTDGLEHFHEVKKRLIIELVRRPNKDLQAKLKIILGIYRIITIYIWATHILEYILLPKLRMETAKYINGDIEKFIGDASYPEKKNALEKMENEIRNGTNFAYLSKKYGWMRARDGFARPYSVKEIAKHAKELKNNHTIHNHPQIPKPLQTLYKEARELVYYRTQRTDVYYELLYLARPILRATAKKYNIPFAKMRYYTLHSLVAGKPKKYPSNFSCIGYKNQIVYFSKPVIRDAVNRSVKEVKGIIAQAGAVKGIAKVVMFVEHLDKVKKGNIMVTYMTSPNFLPAMKLAAAFVTDEGGLTCHAAIVAREMKKPCIIGTKIATKVLKDGMTVEVDANRGIVRIIK